MRTWAPNKGTEEAIRNALKDFGREVILDEMFSAMVANGYAGCKHTVRQKVVRMVDVLVLPALNRADGHRFLLMKDWKPTPLMLHPTRRCRDAMDWFVQTSASCAGGGADA